MNRKFLHLLIFAALAIGCGTAGHKSDDFSLPLPTALTKAAEAGDLEAYLIATDGTETKSTIMTIADGQVSGTLNLKPGTWTLEIQFFQMSASGNWIPVAFISFGSREIGKDGLSIGYDPSEIRFSESGGIQPSISSSVEVPSGCLSRFDCDGDGYSNFEEIKNRSNPEDATSLPPPAVIPVTCGNGARESDEECDDGNLVSADGCSASCRTDPALTLNLTAGQTVRDRVTVRADASNEAGIKSLLLIDPTGMADENSEPGVYITTWNTTVLTEDTNQTLTFEAEDKNGRKSTKSVTVKVDNVPNIVSFGTDQLIQFGGGAMLTWEANNFSTVSIDNIGTVDAQSSTTVLPGSTTIYKLTATRTNSGNSFSASREVTITVNHAPTFDGHTTTLLGQDPAGGTTVSFNRSDSDSGETLTSTVTLFKSSDCTGTAVTTSSSTGGSVNFSNLDPRTNYSYTVSVTDGRGGSASGPCQSFTTADTGLVGWWRFEEGSGDFANDSSGNNNTGNLIPVPSVPSALTSPIWVAGVSGQALDFDGIDDHVDIPNNTSLPFGTGDFAIDLWVNRNNASGMILSKDDGAKGFQLNLGPDTNIFNFYTRECATFLSADYRQGAGRWNHLVVTRKGDLFSVYLDGRLQKAASCPNVDLTNTTPLRVGCDNTSCGSPYNGGVDDLAIYNRTISVDEVRQDCRRNDPTGTTCPDPKEPIVLTPLPGQTLPPTRAYWSWRGERGRDGSLLYPQMGYEVLYDRDNDNNGSFVAPGDSLNNLVESTTSGVIVFDQANGFIVTETPIVSALRGYRLHIRPIETGTTLTQFESTRLFSTDNSVVGWWNFDSVGAASTVFDLTANDFDGELINFPGVGLTGGLLGSALSFDGIDDFVNIRRDAPEYPDSIHPLTLEAWVNPDLSQSCWIMNKSSGGNGYRLAIGGADRVAGFTFGDGFIPGDKTAQISVGLASGWRQMAATHDGASEGAVGTGAIFHNGTLGGTVVGPMREAQSGIPPNLEIGRDMLGSGYCKGVIDEVRVYQRALSTQDLCNSYLATCFSANASAGLTCDTSCVGD